MAQLQVQAHAHRLSDLTGKLLRLVRPCAGVEVDKHVVASPQVGPRVNFGNLQQARPRAIELLRELSRPRVVRAAVKCDGDVAPGKFE
eukprot:7378864-Prymnesium_polylepis.1